MRSNSIERRQKCEEEEREISIGLRVFSSGHNAWKMVLWRVGQQQYKVRYETKPRGLTGVTAAGFLFIFPWIGKGILCKFLFFLVYLTPSAFISFIFCSFFIRNVLANLDFIFRNWKRVFVENVKDFVVNCCFVAVVLESFQLCLLLHNSCEIRGSTNKSIGLNSKSVRELFTA